MDFTERAANSMKGRLARTFAKVLRIRSVTGILHNDGIPKIKSQEKVREGSIAADKSQYFDEDEEKLRYRASLEAFIAKLFASISSVKAAYAQLQDSQSPYDVEGIQSADKSVVTELKLLSELKQCFIKKQLDQFDPSEQLLAERQEQQNLLKTYDIMRKKLESQLKLKDSEVTFLREKLEESEQQNRLIERRLNPSWSLSVLENLHLSGLNPNHFITVLKYAVKSIRSFVKLMIHEMESAGWDLDAAAHSIEPGVVYVKPNHKRFAFEAFVCREMFDCFHYPNFSLPNESLPERKHRRRHFFDKFTELKSLKPHEFFDRKPRSTFGKFCRLKYLKLVHSKMESSFFGDLNQRNFVNSGGYPETAFFATFAEMARRIWLLHCFAFSFETEASIFQVDQRCRFSEVYMESLAEDASLDINPCVAFTVVPGFKIGKTIIQCQVYLSPARTPASS